MSDTGKQQIPADKARGQKVVPAPFARRVPERAPVGKQNEAKKTERSASKIRKNKASLSYFLFVILPTVAVAVYYALVSADQYMVETRFAVRNASMSTGSSLLSSLGLGLGGTSVSDTYIVLEYIHSREILQRISQTTDLRAMFRKAPLDYYASLPQDATMEELLDYWKWMVEVNLDHTSQILTVRTFAFTPEDAYTLAAAILRESERKINELSEKARRDAVAYAEEEVRKAEERVRKVRQKFLQFRNKTQQIDPAKQAQVQVMLIGKLEEQLSELRTKLSEARSYLRENAPTVVFFEK
jgi:capsular polysaccharide transport system permease protein